MCSMASAASRKYCIAFGCLNTNKTVLGLTMFKLPKEPERRQEWLKILDRGDLLKRENLKHKSFTVCSDHFDDSSIQIIKHLKAGAIPIRKSNIKILHNEQLKKPDKTSIGTQTELVNCTIGIQTPLRLTEVSPRKRKLSLSLKTTDSKRRRLEKLTAEEVSIEINPKFKKLIEWRKKIRKAYRVNFCNPDSKVFALNLQYSSPQAYRSLYNILKLPSVSTLKRFNVKITPKLDNKVFESINSKMASLPPEARYCTICVDEMVLKKNILCNIKNNEMVGFHDVNGKTSADIANNAYVVMLQGLCYNWKQPIAYALLASTNNHTEINEWIDKIIRRLHSIGIVVKAVISDQGSNFDKYSKVLKSVTIERPYFFVDEMKIYYIFDVPHLVKCVRNNLLTSDFSLNNEIISWDYIKELYDLQKEKKVRLIPKITNAHINPNHFQKMRVKYATQVFSNTVSAAIETYIHSGKLSEMAKPTANFIKKMDGIFDILNYSKVKGTRKMCTAFRKSREQVENLQNAKQMFNKIEAINRHDIKTFINFQITIESILQLFDDLKNEGIKYIFTRRLNKDSVENFFGALRQQGGFCFNPTPVQFTRAFSKLFFVNMLKHSPTANCEMDMYESLFKLIANKDEKLKEKE